MNFSEALETAREFVTRWLPVTAITEEITETEFRLPDNIKELEGRDVRYRFMFSSHLTTYGKIKLARVNKRTKRVELLIEPDDKDKLPRVFEPSFVKAFVWRVQS